MTEREMEQKLKKAVEDCTPDVLDKIMAGCDEQKGQVISMPKKKSFFPRFVAIAAAFVLVIGLGTIGVSRMQAGRVASIVALEINPSMELRINRDEEIVEVIAHNQDAKKVLEGMKLEGTNIHTATNAIIGSLLKHGYIDELANSVLVSVEDEDAVRGDKLQKKLAEEMDAILKGMSVNASILSQYVVGVDVDADSKQYDISHGKAALIKRILEANNTYDYKELATLSVHELNLILSNSKNHVTGVQATGSASDSAYIGVARAKEVALQHAGISEYDVREMDAEMDYEYHKMVYEIEFDAKGQEYTYYVDAITGEVAGYEKELSDDIFDDDDDDEDDDDEDDDDDD